MTEIIVKTRQPDENEFFFKYHENIGSSEEFSRLVKYINNNSNINFVKIDIETVDQMQMAKNYCGKSFNFKIISKE
tara:strand:- start:572 stop:799 length:228 start_codon:yes stop_codon:yes gene_type:complete